MASASGNGVSNGSGSPCGACKFLRRRCATDCIFAPYFCSEQGPARFAAIHKVFGASNISKLLLHIPTHDRCEAVVTITYEAQARIRDPVYGCVSHIFALQQQEELQFKLLSLGNFMLQMQDDGNLVLKACQWSDPAYWYTSTTTRNVNLEFNATSALLHLVSGSKNTYPLTKNSSTPMEDYYHRATIYGKGNFHQYAYHRKNGTGWRRVWKAVEDPCRLNLVCGVYGLCTCKICENEPTFY
ncbi:hypothetical protein JHK87_049615 [Glycine soja]|nr:hypothetical protein JHK87_049615 [Glycine soja]